MTKAEIEQAAKLLPCGTESLGMIGALCIDGKHDEACPAYYGPAVAAAFAELMEENAVLDEHNRIVHQQLVEAEVKLNELMEDVKQLTERVETTDACHIDLHNKLAAAEAENENWKKTQACVVEVAKQAEQRAAQAELSERVKGMEAAVRILHLCYKCDRGEPVELHEVNDFNHAGGLDYCHYVPNGWWHRCKAHKIRAEIARLKAGKGDG